jgi:DnaJ-class molecular chaperone
MATETNRVCRACKGRGQYNKYVRPGVVAPVKCEYCKGTGRIRIEPIREIKQGRVRG